MTHAQGVLTLQPGRSASTLAGNGIAGYTGDGLVAANATVAQPSAMGYDAAGNLFFADTQNHVIREQIAATGLVVTVAGTGMAGFSGDGGQPLPHSSTPQPVWPSMPWVRCTSRTRITIACGGSWQV
ncbi:MAG: hypothetical protein ACRYG8_06440 [Janthinobacterium lividum]